MADREKVIKGLEVCISREPGKYTCHKCPYETAGNVCEIKLSEDAIAMLKDDDKRIRLLEQFNAMLGEPRNCPHCGKEV